MLWEFVSASNQYKRQGPSYRIPHAENSGSRSVDGIHDYRRCIDFGYAICCICLLNFAPYSTTLPCQPVRFIASHPPP
ncbi:hypothetical protein H9L39_03173 [Fusarium oxysporum f. sp. albedinis]|nr:hypothetical protein H9L39_03173 [Fusarium oxysporum f. sp. albedinis]